MTGTVSDLGNSINAANRAALTDMINLANAAAGNTISVNDVTLGTAVWTKNHDGIGGWQTGTGDNIQYSDEATTNQLNAAAGEDAEAGTNATTIERVVVAIDRDIQAGGLVELQFKIDQMMAAVQEGIKNTGKVSQTREGAARA